MHRRKRRHRILAALICGALMFSAATGRAGSATLFWQENNDAGPALLRPASGGLLSNRPSDSLFGSARAPMIGPFERPAPPEARVQTRVPQRDVERLIATPPHDFTGLGALGCIAVSIYHEARNQPLDGQYAVGSVILTRAANPDRWGDTPCAVVQPVQFSYLSADRGFARITEPGAWETAVRIAAQVLEDGPSPSLRGADHYHATYVWPDWNQHMVSVGKIADHVFWRSVARAD